MIKSLIDSGPLYALYDKSDSYHERIVDFMRSYKGFLYTSDFVIAEVSHLLRRSVRAQIVFWEFISAGGLHVMEFKKEYYSRILELAKKYRDLPMDLADGSLLVLAEEHSIPNIITIDGDYKVYRTKGKKALKNLFKVL
ncbi:MAG TPA: PIN domain-containing protein [Leptospiraceae bacterium]|nr:PIN domain-containing protein [Leptospiraceae bacterium]HRG75652.1 PIN domain-containing protein [Leptospiraceae bacterium]